MFNTTGHYCERCLPGFVGDALKRTCVEVTRIPTSTRNKSSTQGMTLDPKEKFSYKTLALLSLYIFCVLSFLLLVFLCIKARLLGRDHMLKNTTNGNGTVASEPNAGGSRGLAAHFHSALASLDQSIKPLRTRLSLYFGSMCPTTMRFVRVASNHANGGYSGKNSSKAQLSLYKNIKLDSNR